MKTDSWQLQAVPAYTDGVLFPELFELGSGWFEVDDSDKASSAAMHLINETSATAFKAYCNRLTAAGFRAGFSRDEAHGLYREFIGDGFVVYTYFMKRYGQVRVILDRTTATVADFEQAAPGELSREDTELMQYGLYIGEPVVGVISSCGMLYVIRTKGNRLFLVDGGENPQATDEALTEVMVRLRDITGTEDGEQINICCWFCTHAHDDHYEFFLAMMKKYAHVLHVERTMFNFPNSELVGDRKPDPEHFAGMRRYVAAVQSCIQNACPDAVHLRPHTGERFSFDNLTVEILQTHEDLFYENQKNVCIPGLNASSTIVKLSFEGKSLLILGDCDEENGDVLQKYYLPEELSCTYLQAAHHLANRDENIYSYVKADTVLIPQSRIRTHKIRRNHYEVLCRYYDRDKFFLQGDYTVVFRVKEGEEDQITYHQLMGRPFEAERDSHNLAVCIWDYLPKKS